MQKTTTTYQVDDNNIVEQYGEKTSNILGVDLIKSIKEVSSKSLGLGNDAYPCVYKLGNHPLLKTHHAVRGTLPCGKRKFIAVKIDVLNESHKHIYTITEIIFQRYSGWKDGYMVIPQVTTDSGTECWSLLYEKDCGSIDFDLYNLKKILTGKNVEVARYKKKLRDPKHFKDVVTKINDRFDSRNNRAVIVILRKHTSPPLKLNSKIK